MPRALRNRSEEDGSGPAGEPRGRSFTEPEFDFSMDETYGEFFGKCLRFWNQPPR